MPFYKVVYDGRYPVCAAFAEWMRKRGIATRALDDGDVTNAWFNDLALRWRQSPAAIAGMTAPEALFCLEELAHDHRMRVTFRADHRLRSGDVLEHCLRGPPSMPREVMAMREGTAWYERMAELAVQCSRRRPALAAEPYVLLDRGSAVRPLPTSLVSWVIAPVSPA
jgi:hypothetical protein